MLPGKSGDAHTLCAQANTGDISFPWTAWLPLPLALTFWLTFVDLRDSTHSSALESLLRCF